MEEIELQFSSVRYRFESEENTCICVFRRPGDPVTFMNEIAVKLDDPDNELRDGLTYRLYGKWTDHLKYGRQFHAKSFTKIRPHNHDGIVRYLMQAPHIGRKLAETLWEMFGGEAVATLRTQPEMAAEFVERLKLEHAQEAAVYLEHEAKVEDMVIELFAVLANKGFPHKTTKKAIREWGNEAAEVIKRDPYQLMRFKGCSFGRCDQLWKSLGLPLNAWRRQIFSAWYAVANSSDHTWFGAPFVAREIENSIGSGANPFRALRGAKLCGLVAVRKTGDPENPEVFICEKKRHRQEQSIANVVARLRDGKGQWPAAIVEDESLSPHQKERLFNALGYNDRIAILGGSPGTGKTYTAARLIKAIIAEHGAGGIRVAAPTGKAAVRITEAMSAYDLPLAATTIHSLLGVQSHDGERDGGWGFAHDNENPLDCRFLVIDESSMIDTPLMASLLAAAHPCNILLIGDINQLPPVGHGAPLRDMIAAGVPYGELKEIQRNAGTVVRACAAIRDGQFPGFDEVIDPASDKNLKHIETKTDEETLAVIVEKIKQIRDKGICDPVWDVQVIVPRNDASVLSRKNINKILQAELNRSVVPQVAGSPFRVDDKVVCLKNGMYERVGALGEGPRYVANGEQGRVSHVEPKMVHIKIGEDFIKVPRSAEGEADGRGSGCDWDLAYAITGHKSQGSEWKAIFVVLDPAGGRVGSREWFYTALSRLKLMGFTVGKLAVARTMCRRSVLKDRKTFLAEAIKEEMKNRCLESKSSVANKSQSSPSTPRSGLESPSLAIH